MFTRFFRAEDALVQASSGTGLGLSIAKSFVELQGGRLWFESELGNGTTFSFSLPLASEREVASAAREFKTISYRAEDKHVLVIEDEIDIANQISNHLRSQGGYRVHISRTGQDALEYLADKDHRVDLITLDLRLPDTDGFSVLRKIKNNKSLQDIPVVIASILHREKEGRVLGACAYIPKPIQEGQLLSTIEQALSKKAKVLVVEDDRQLAGMLRDALDKYGYTVVIEHNGRQVVDTAKNAVPEMILLDIKLPGLDGYQVLAQLKETPETCDIPVIMITGSVTDIDDKRQRVLEMGAAQFLTKPLSIEDLVVEIRNTVDQDAAPSN
jgi:DNA-binding response OmpR family regulator